MERAIVSIEGSLNDMNICSTRLSSTPLSLNSNKNRPIQAENSPTPDRVTLAETDQQQVAWPRVIRGAVGATLGAGVGVLAGMNSGMVAGLAGASVTALPGAFVGGVAGAVLAERLGQGESSKIAGAGLWGAVAGGLIAAAGGAALGSQLTGIGAAAALGLVGGVTGLMATI